RVTILRDARAGTYLVGGEGPNRPVDGNNVVLTIDSVVQFIAEQALTKAVDKYHAASGSAIVLDPRDGSILAMASVPTFGPQRFYQYIRRFGFGERTGVQLPGEAVGTVRRTEKWSMLSNASMSIGQEISVTPLQIALAMSAVANGGMRVAPRIVERVIDPN